MPEQMTPEDAEGEQAEEHAAERGEAAHRDERTVTESGGYGAPERGKDEEPSGD
jgi:hypothetical protein